MGGQCCGTKRDVKKNSTGCCASSSKKTPRCGESDDVFAGKIAYFDDMICDCLEYACRASDAGKKIVGIMCEYTPREIIMAAGAVPVCLCGGSNNTIPSAEEILPVNLCPLIKSTFGYHIERSNPFLEMADLIVAETTCDGKKKMYEQMAKTRPMYVLELPQKQRDANAMDHWRREILKFKKELEKLFGVSITKTRLNNAIRLMNRERALRRELAGLMKKDNPPLSGRQLLGLKSSISGRDVDLAQYEKILAAARGKVAPQGQRPVRVLLTGVPLPHGAERVMDIIESSGGLVVCAENCTGVKPILDDVAENAADPLAAIAEKYYHLPCSVQTPNADRIKLLERLIREYRPDCVVELVWQACLTYDVESADVKELARRRKLPYLKISTDYSPADSARIAMRIEAIFETIKCSKGPKARRKKCRA